MSCRVLKHAFGGVKGAEYQDIGTSRGGANTKIRAVCDCQRNDHRHLSEFGALT
jgi:hypothetical protein